MLKYAIALSALLISNAYAVDWVRKPIQCGTHKELNSYLTEQGQEVLFGAVGRYVTEDMVERNEIDPQPTAVYMFYNAEFQTFTFVEYQNNEEVCVLAVGDGVEFDPKVLNEYLKEMFDETVYELFN